MSGFVLLAVTLCVSLRYVIGGMVYLERADATICPV